MVNYLELNYAADEYSPEKYPQKLCDFLVKQYFQTAESPKTLLDIGSGKGNFLVGFSRNGINVKGIDKRKECLRVLSDFDVRECDLETDRFPFEDSYFDFVFSKSVIEHVRNTGQLIKETYRVLKPGGITVQLTPDWAAQHKVFWDDPTHVKPFTRKGFQNVFKLENFVDVCCERFYQLPFLWKHPVLIFVPSLISLLPDKLKWKDKEERVQRVIIRHSKEPMLLVSAKKPE